MGIESNQADANPVIALVPPGPVVTMQTPGLCENLDEATAAKADVTHDGYKLRLISHFSQNAAMYHGTTSTIYISTPNIYKPPRN